MASLRLTVAVAFVAVLTFSEAIPFVYTLPMPGMRMTFPMRMPSMSTQMPMLMNSMMMGRLPSWNDMIIAAQIRANQQRLMAMAYANAAMSQIPATINPATVVPATVAPAAVIPAAVAPAAVAPTVVAPAAVAPTVVDPASVASAVVAPAILDPAATLAAALESITSKSSESEESIAGGINSVIPPIAVQTNPLGSPNNNFQSVSYSTSSSSSNINGIPSSQQSGQVTINDNGKVTTHVL